MGKIYQIQVSGVKGEKKVIDVANSDEEFNNTTVSAFKEKLVEKFPELKGGEFRLLFADVELQDSDTFSQREIKDHSTVFIIVRLPGGSAVKNGVGA